MRQFNVNRRMLSIILCIVLICTLTLSIAYAALSAVLTISGNAEVVASSWDVYLDNIKVTSGSVNTGLPIITSKTTVNFSTNLSIPGDYYEFTVDVVNNGTIDAMIDSISKTPTLTDKQAKYLNYIIEYQNGESINSKQLLEKNSFVRLKVRVEFRDDIMSSDLPTVSETLNLTFTVDYVQSDIDIVKVENNGVEYSMKFVTGNVDTIGSEVCVKEECFYIFSSGVDTVKLISKYNLHVGSVLKDEDILEPLNNPTGIQDSSAIGCDGDGEGVIYYPCIGIVPFSDVPYWDSNGVLKPEYGMSYDDYPNVYNSNSRLYSYIENYKNYLISIGLYPLEARIPLMQDLENIEGTDSVTDDINKILLSSSYWYGNAMGNLAGNNMLIASMKPLNAVFFANYSAETAFGIRPVIVVSKKDFPQ